MTSRMQHPGRAANITKGFISLRIGRHASRRGGVVGGWGGVLKRGLEDSNQTCCDINKAPSGNLVRKIRYDYRESASGENVAAKAISDCSKPFQGESTEWSSWLWQEMQSLFSYKEARRWNILKQKEVVEVETLKVTWNLHDCVKFRFKASTFWSSPGVTACEDSMFSYDAILYWSYFMFEEKQSRVDTRRKTQHRCQRVTNPQAVEGQNSLNDWLRHISVMSYSWSGSTASTLWGIKARNGKYSRVCDWWRAAASRCSVNTSISFVINLKMTLEAFILGNSVLVTTIMFLWEGKIYLLVEIELKWMAWMTTDGCGCFPALVLLPPT